MNDGIQSFISTLPNPLPQFCKDATDTDTDTNTTAAEKVDDFEIATRSHLLTLVQTLLQANSTDDHAVLEESIEEILIFIRGTIDFTFFIVKIDDQDINTAQLRKLPFLLLEDAVDTLPLHVLQIVWQYGPSTWLQTLCKNENNTCTTLFHQGSKYCLIRMCNKLLKNLSTNAQDEAAQFAGEISMILASVFPLSERSAVNVLGAFHVDGKYQVEYETLDEWLEGSSGNSGGGGSTGPAKKRNLALNYDFYSKFWGVQRTFTDPKDLLPRNNPNASGWNQNMERFVKDLQDVLGAFEGHGFKADLVKHLKTRWNAIKKSKVNKSLQMEAMAETISEAVGMDEDVEMEDFDKSAGTSVSNAKRQYKYLTNSQLLHLQLQEDPEIRVHFLKLQM